MKLLLLALIGFLAPPQPAPSTPVQFDAEAERALTLFKNGKPREALAVLDAVEPLTQGKLARVASLAFYRGRCLLDLNQPAQALKAFERFTALAETDKDREQGRLWIAKTNRRFFGVVRFHCTESEVRITRQGKSNKSTQACPAQWDQLVPGLYHFQIKGGKHAGERRVEVVAGKQLTIDLDTDRQTIVAPKVDEPISSTLGFGVHARAGSSWAVGEVDETVNGSGAMGLETGLSASLVWQLGSVGVGPRLELGYRSWTYELETTDNVKQSVNTHGLSIPVLLLVTLPAQLELEAGVGTEWLLDQTDGLDDDLLFSAIAGAGWHLPFDSWQAQLTVRYAYDLQDLARSGLRRQSLLAGLGVHFGL